MGRIRKGYLPTLDGWRSIAILAVILQHAYGFTHLGLTHVSQILHWSGVVDWVPILGEKGVELFFGISGFLITTRLIEEHNVFHEISLKGFYIRRASRILPASLTYLAITAVLGSFGLIAVHPKEVIASVFFFRNYFDQAGWFTGHFWSLAVEEHFYLVWPSLVVLFGLLRSRWVAFAGVMTVFLWRTAHWQLMLTSAKYHSDLRFDGLLLGCLGALFFEKLRGLLNRRIMAFLPLALLLIYIAINGITGPLLSLAKLGQSAAVALVIVATVANPTWRFSQLLETRILRWVGSLSYSLYLWQQIFLTPLSSNHQNVVFQTLLRIALAFVFAYLSYRLIEKPAIRLGHRLAPPPTPGRGDLTKAEANAAGATATTTA